jgi:precorrin-6A/cobalt-precorrin-6A reductase
LTVREHWSGKRMAERPLLILGGTTLALALAKQLAARDIPAIYSLAGRTVPKALPDIEVRSGGFGGAEALRDYVQAKNIRAVIDATHAYARQISLNAAATGHLLLRLSEEPWQQVVGDRWTAAEDISAARDVASAIADRVFVTTGRQGMDEFVHDTRCWWLARVIAPGPDLDRGIYIQARGPFEKADELELLRDHSIDAVISKNAGGTATYPKIAAARELGLPVIMIDRARSADTETVHTVEAAMAWISTLGA